MNWLIGGVCILMILTAGGSLMYYLFTGLWPWSYHAEDDDDE